MLDLPLAYAQTHQSLVSLLSGLDENALATTVPATPDWTVRDVVAHLIGVASDALSGDGWQVYGAVVNRSAMAALDTRTADQVSDRRSVPFDALLDEWAHVTESLVPILAGDRPAPVAVPFADRMVVTDLATHAQDVRGALGVPGDRESLGVSVAFSSYAGGLHLRLSGSGLSPLLLRYGEKERLLGDPSSTGGEPGATVSAERFELYRAMAGRRSTRQILAYAWTGDPAPYVPFIPAYGERASDLIE
jgi:uncharacterized protein (TIGR03083 family)